MGAFDLVGGRRLEVVVVQTNSRSLDCEDGLLRKPSSSLGMTGVELFRSG